MQTSGDQSRENDKLYSTHRRSGEAKRKPVLVNH